MAPISRIQNTVNKITKIKFKNEKFFKALDQKKILAAFHSPNTKSKQYDLEQKIDLEIKMREGTTRLLAACKHEMQSLEAAKSLVTSNERMNAYTLELQRRKQEDSNNLKLSKQQQLKPCKAKLAISDIRMPLLWKDSDHFKNKGDYRRFSVFCLIKCGTEIYDTVLLNNVDRSMTDINFDDTIVLGNIPHDFELKLEVYGRVIQDDLSMASTPRKLKQKFSSSVSRTFGKKLGAALKDELNDPFPKFELLAKSSLRLADSDESICTYDLKLVKGENRQSQLPLFGLFCCRLAVQPYCLTEERLSGYLRGLGDPRYDLSMTGQKSDIKSRPIYWACLINFKLYLWCKSLASVNNESLKERRSGPADLMIDVNRSTILRKGEDPLSFTLINGRDSKYTLFVLNKEDRDVWTSNIEVHIKEHRVWGKAAEKLMTIPETLPSKLPSLLCQRLPGSLYDQTPLPEKLKCNSSTTSSLNYSTYDLRSKKSSASESLRSRSSSLSSETDSSSSAHLGTNAKWANTHCSGMDLYRNVQIPRIASHY